MVLITTMKLGATSKILRAAAVCVASFPILPVMAHGYVESPISRAAACQQSINRECGPVQYEPQSVEYVPQMTSAGGVSAFPEGGPKDGQIASGGVSRFSQLDLYGVDQWHSGVIRSDRIRVAIYGRTSNGLLELLPDKKRVGAQSAALAAVV